MLKSPLHFDRGANVAHVLRRQLLQLRVDSSCSVGVEFLPRVEPCCSWGGGPQFREAASNVNIQINQLAYPQLWPRNNMGGWTIVKRVL